MTTNNITDNEVIDTTAPEKIWLVIGEEGNYQDSTGGFEEICWCEDKQGDNDVKYIRADLAKQETAREIAELKVELEIAQGDNVLHRYRSAQLTQEIHRLEESLEKNKAFAENDKSFLDKITELQSQVNMLREALVESNDWLDMLFLWAKNNNLDRDAVITYVQQLDKKQRTALSATAKQSLIEHDNEVLDRAAKVCAAEGKNLLADKIRELKGEIC